ncbi:MAG: YCF48-related protein [Fimbriimonadaceae bacterium]
MTSLSFLQALRSVPLGSRALALSGLVLVSAAAVAQTWVKQSAIPTPRHLSGVAFTSPTHGFVVGEANTVLETFDGGATWTARNLSLPTVPFNDIYFVDSQSGFIFGNTESTSENFRTTNGGATWSRFDLPAGSWREMKFVSATTGFVGGNGVMCRTTDGGDSWQTQSAYPVAPIVHGMDFKDSTTGLVCGYHIGTNKGGVFKTSDGGVTWVNKFEGFINDALWLDANVVLACGDTSIYRSTNAGETWSLYASGIDTGLIELVKVSPTTVFGVSLKGDVWRSANGGLTWTQVYDGLGDLPVSWNIGFSNAQNGWVVGQGGLMLRTDDGGMTWSQATTGFGTQWFQIEMASDLVGYIAGHNGYILRTFDGGEYWDLQKVEVTGQIFGRDESLRAVSVVNANTVVVAGPGGTVFKTLDGGGTWQNIGFPNLPGAFWIEDVKFLTALEGWVVGLDQDIGHFRSVYHTTDGGLTWTLAMEQNTYFYSVDFVGTQRGWIASIGSLYFRTVDGGVNWTSHVLPARFTGARVSEIRFATADVGWVVGWDGLVGKSVDGGVTFTYQDLGRDDVHMFALSIVSTSEVWISGRTESFQPVVYRTVNGGTTWTQMQGPSGEQNWLFGLASRPGGKVWGVGYDGIVYRTSNTQQVGPSSIVAQFGTVLGGGLAQVLTSDDAYFTVQNAFNISRADAPIQVIAEAVSPVASPTSLSFTLEAAASVAGLTQRIELFNFATGAYEAMDARAVTVADSTVVVTAGGALGRFIEPGTRKMRARLTWRRFASDLPRTWNARLDFVVWSVGG